MALKSAYELATERIILPSERREPRKSYIPEFVSDFTYPGGKKKEENMEFSKAFVEHNTPTHPSWEKMPPKKSLSVESNSAETKPDDFPEVIWNGQFLDYGGFARMNRAMAFGLTNKGMRVKVDMLDQTKEINDSTEHELINLSKSAVGPLAPTVYGVTVPTRMSQGGRRIIYTMMETSEGIHKDYAGKLNMFDEIWVASEYGRKLFAKSGINPPTYTMPLGVDTERYCPSDKKLNFGLKGFVFVSVFKWSYRKGYDILLKAFMEEFSSHDDVSLLIVSRPLLGNNSQTMVNDFTDIKNSIKKDEGDLPHIALYTNPIPERKMPMVYNSANAFVLISRGEGTGLPYLEAAACGLPVIGSNCSGQTDFLKPDNSFLVEPDGFVTIKASGGHLHQLAKQCHFYDGQTFPEFGRKAIESTKQHMRFVYENYSVAEEAAGRLRKRIIKEYTWDKAVDRVFNRLIEIGG